MKKKISFLKSENRKDWLFLIRRGEIIRKKEKRFLFFIFEESEILSFVKILIHEY